MATNKNALLRYQVLERCFPDFRHKYTIDELIDKVNDRLIDLCGTEVGVHSVHDVLGDITGIDQETDGLLEEILSITK